MSYTTGIAPRGLWKITEEEDCILWKTFLENKIFLARDVEYEEVFNFPTLDKQLSPDSWVHINTNILKVSSNIWANRFNPSFQEGKVAHSEAPEEVEDKDLWLVQRKKQDPFEARLKPLSQDRGIFFFWIGKNLPKY